MTVRSLRNGRTFHRFRIGEEEQTQQEAVQQIVVTPTTATAWVEFHPEVGCLSHGYLGNSCRGTFSIYAIGRAGSRTLATNLAAQPTPSLNGTDLTWTAGGQRSSTMLA
ncbi:MAG TPA: hypothetical protein VEJ23_07500 [Solirubrobacteraceae bacterium]|nr:hypothetical protein [Solirubrobacteraceae bacterium]